MNRCPYYPGCQPEACTKCWEYDMKEPTYRDGINRAAEEVQIVCDRLDKSQLGQTLAEWLRGLPDRPDQPHPQTAQPLPSLYPQDRGDA